MSLFTIRQGVNNHPEDTFLQQLTDLIRTGGVIGLADGDYEVEEPDGGGLNVDVNPGRGYVKGSGNAYPIRNTSVETVSIDSNSSGNPRITSIVAVVDLSASPVSDGGGDDVHELVAVNGTPASSPQAPDAGAIQTAVGGASPWIRLADVEVAHGASGISNANITDRRRRAFFKNPTPLVVVSYTASYTHDFNDTNQFVMTLTGNVTVNQPDNMEVGDMLLMRFIQDGSGGRTITFASGINLKSADTDPNSTANKTTSYAIHKVASDAYDLFLIGKDYD